MSKYKVAKQSQVVRRILDQGCYGVMAEKQHDFRRFSDFVVACINDASPRPLKVNPNDVYQEPNAADGQMSQYDPRYLHLSSSINIF